MFCSLDQTIDAFNDFYFFDIGLNSQRVTVGLPTRRIYLRLKLFSFVAVCLRPLCISRRAREKQIRGTPSLSCNPSQLLSKCQLCCLVDEVFYASRNINGRETT